MVFHKTLYIFVSYAKEFTDFLTVMLSNFCEILEYFLDFKTKKNFCTPGWEHIVIVKIKM